MNIDRSAQSAYETAMQELISELKSFADSRGATFISVHTDVPIEKMLFKELLKVGIMA